MLDEARQFDRIGRRGFDNNVQSDWSQIQQELRVISDAYGLGNGGGYNNGGYYPNGQNYPNNRNRNNNDWWRRIPWPN